MRHVCASKTLGSNVIYQTARLGRFSGDPGRFVDLTLTSY